MPKIIQIRDFVKIPSFSALKSRVFQNREELS